MKALIDHARMFPQQIEDRRDEFAELAHGQRPQALFISCSDSRVVPALFTGARPGEIFELRTAGNIVPRYGWPAACAVAGTLEFAVEALQVPEIVVCGHSHCGAVRALINRRSVRDMPLVERWITRAGHAPDSPAEHDLLPDPDHEAVARRHLLTQLGHLTTYPCVARRLAEGRLRLHAWFYTIDTGRVFAHRPDTGAFDPL
ncbi:carbonic anhydrase [Sphaerisporangium rufum]|uniref:Carbonic anhydrase n=1 Tax=Sphaerisporangium rufum TaxID=1381558 RepID=A0A919R136_9ACTN|nr:carbonic anhydrase [Sphaerisporangium rufum]GII77048.1 carbonic anhydrase [Sphaerisporangium rufum]